jgi:hypothetical protein
MSQPNSVESARAHAVDGHPSSLKRPWFVTASLVLLWGLLVVRALGSISRIAMIPGPIDSHSASYITYLATMILVPGFLLVRIAGASSWARNALLVLYALNTLFRVYLFVNDGQFTASGAAWLIAPVVVDFIALALLFVPTSNHWFGFRPNKPLVQMLER